MVPTKCEIAARFIRAMQQNINDLDEEQAMLTTKSELTFYSSILEKWDLKIKEIMEMVLDLDDDDYALLSKQTTLMEKSLRQLRIHIQSRLDSADKNGNLQFNKVNQNSIFIKPTSSNKCLPDSSSFIHEKKLNQVDIKSTPSSSHPVVTSPLKSKKEYSKVQDKYSNLSCTQGTFGISIVDLRKKPLSTLNEKPNVLILDNSFVQFSNDVSLRRLIADVKLVNILAFQQDRFLFYHMYRELFCGMMHKEPILRLVNHSVSNTTNSSFSVKRYSSISVTKSPSNRFVNEKPCLNKNKTFSFAKHKKLNSYKFLPVFWNETTKHNFDVSNLEYDKRSHTLKLSFLYSKINLGTTCKIIVTC